LNEKPLSGNRGRFSRSFDEKPPEHGQDFGEYGDFICYPVTGIIAFGESLSLETEGGFFFFI
jgi:hypothetical protein